MNKIKLKVLCCFVLTAILSINTYATNADSLKMESYFELAEEYWDKENSDSAIFFIDNAIQSSKNLNYPERTGKFLINKARIYFDDSQIEKTFDLLEEAIGVYKHASNKSGESLALLYKGYFHEKNGAFDKAIITYKEGLGITKQIKDTTITGTLFNNLSVAYHALGDYETSIKYLIESIHYRESENSPNIGISYGNLGNAYKRQENYTEAILWYQKSLEALQGDNFAKARVVCLRNMGDTYSRMGKYNKAEKNLKASYDIAKGLGNNQRDLAMYHFFMGSMYLKQEKLDSAIYMLNEAIRLFPQKRNFIFRSNSHLHLAEIYLKRIENNSRSKQILLNKAIENAEKSRELAESSGVIKQLNEAARVLMKVYGKASNSKKTLQYAELYGTSLDSLNRLERSKKVIEMQTKFEVEKKELQIELLGKENSLKEADLQQTKKNEAQQRQITIISIIALIISVVAAIFLYRLYGQKKRANAELERKNALISEQKEEKEVLLKEIHHRVKNNLQVVSSLLDLQTNNIDDESTLLAIEDGQSRVQAMALIHQNLYQNQDIGSISFEEYANQLVKQLASVYEKENRVEVELKSKETYFDIDTAIPIGLILNELVSNAYKYAFKEDTKGKLNIRLEEIREGEYALTVSDNGAGLPSDFKVEKTKSLGLRLVHRLSRQLYGQVEYLHEQGAMFRILFKDTNQRKLVQ